MRVAAASTCAMPQMTSEYSAESPRNEIRADGPVDFAFRGRHAVGGYRHGCHAGPGESSVPRTEHTSFHLGTGPRSFRVGRVVLTAEAPEQYWDVVSEHVSSAVVALDQIDETGRQRIRSTVIANVVVYEKYGRTRVPGVARCIAGTKSAQ